MILQDTGFSKVLPSDSGIVAYSDAGEAASAVQSVADEYDRHAAAARHIANDIFDTNEVLGDMLGQIGFG